MRNSDAIKWRLQVLSSLIEALECLQRASCLDADEHALALQVAEEIRGTVQRLTTFGPVERPQDLCGICTAEYVPR